MKINNAQIFKITLYIILILIAIIMAFPFYWMIIISLKPRGQLYEYPLKLYPIFFNFLNYKIAWIEANFSLYFKNTVIYATGRTVLTLLFCSLSGYSFAKLRFPGKNILFLVILFSMMIPFTALLVPMFLVTKNFPLAGGNDLWGAGGSGLLNTLWGLILPGIVSGFSIFMFRQYFSMLPDELIYAARVDGCSEFRIFWEIVTPLSKPVFATLAIFIFMNAWNALLWPLIVINDPKKYVLQIGLAAFQGGEDAAGALWNLMMAGVAITIVPTIIVFLFFQRYFTKGIALTGIKE